jgi:hypothetical protein
VKTEDLKLIGQIGQALYASPETAHTRSLETVAALSTLPELDDDASFEKVTQLLLLQAEREGLKATAQAIANPFYRLSPLERVILGFLHSGQVSYARLSRVLGQTVENIQAIAWQARLKVAGSAEVQLQFRHPIGAGKLKHSCPEYLEDRPWSQKLIDDEMKSTELTFIQNHTLVCESCARVLRQTRELYYAVEKLIPLGVLQGVQSSESLRQMERQLAVATRPTSFYQALKIFSNKRSTWLAVGVIAILWTLAVRF